MLMPVPYAKLKGVLWVIRLLGRDLFKGFPKIGGCLIRGTRNKDDNILGSILGSAYLGNYRIVLRKTTSLE